MDCIIYFFADILVLAPIVSIKMTKTSLIDTIFYFLMQVESTCRICKGRDIAVILTEKRGAVYTFLNLNQDYFIFYSRTQ